MYEMRSLAYNTKNISFEVTAAITYKVSTLSTSMTMTNVTGELREVGLSCLVSVFIDGVHEEVVPGSWPSLRTILMVESN